MKREQELEGRQTHLPHPDFLTSASAKVSSESNVLESCYSQLLATMPLNHASLLELIKGETGRFLRQAGEAGS